MFILSILHNIFLTEEEARRLHEGKSIETVGVSIPVWSHLQNTSEPAEEVFCKYVLTNKNDEIESVEIEKDGYQINLPQEQPAKPIPKISDENWLKINMDPDKRFEWQNNIVQTYSSKSLLPVKEGGSACLKFKKYNKVKRGDKNTSIIHMVEIKLMNDLLESLCF